MVKIMFTMAPPTLKASTTGDTLKLSDSQISEFSAEHLAQILHEYYILRINEFNDVANDGFYEWIHFIKKLRDLLIQHGIKPDDD